MYLYSEAFNKCLGLNITSVNISYSSLGLDSARSDV
jgi:hypothetical protein